MSSLEVGDVVALQVWNRDRGGSTNLIRVQQNSRDRDLSSSETQRIEGTVERVDASVAMFELRATTGANVRVRFHPCAAIDGRSGRAIAPRRSCFLRKGGI